MSVCSSLGAFLSARTRKPLPSCSSAWPPPKSCSTRVEKSVQGVAVHFTENGEPTTLKGTHLLVATGRKPNVKSLSLERAGVAYTDAGIKVNDQLRTTNRRIYAIGDVIGGPAFTHLAHYHAGIAIRNAPFRLKPDASAGIIPRG